MIHKSKGDMLLVDSKTDRPRTTPKDAKDATWLRMVAGMPSDPKYDARQDSDGEFQYYLMCGLAFKSNATKRLIMLCDMESMHSQHATNNVSFQSQVVSARAWAAVIPAHPPSRKTLETG